MIESVNHSLIQLFRQNVEENTKLSAGSIVEISKVPMIIIDGPALIEKKRLMRDPERITAIDEESEKAVREVPPRWYDLRFNVNITSESHSALIEVFRKLSQLNQMKSLLTANDAEGREREYLWRWENAPNVMTAPNISQVFQGHGVLMVYDVEVYSGIQEEYSLIRKVSAVIDRDKIEVKS